MGSYAFQHRKSLNNQFEIGQGLIGQAVLEKQPIIIDNLPDDYLSISSGLGEAKANNLLVCPILYESKVTAVIEIGSFIRFDDICLELLKNVNDAIASVLESSKNRRQMNLLLEDSQNKSQELETQSNKLAQINLNLEEQTRKLKASEEELKAQSEELQVTNEELEEKTQALEAQKRDIESQNENLARSQKLLEEKARELQSSSKYKSEFMSNMSHELRTPLNSLLLLSQSLMENDESNLTPEQLQSAQIIYNSGNELLNLINDILDLSKVEAGKLQVDLSEFDPQGLVEELERQMQPLAQEKGVTLSVITNTDFHSNRMKSDSMRIQQILKNLLSNAIKFTEENGHVSISISLVSYEKLKTLELPEMEYIAFTVQDDGTGISEEDQQSIFEAFQQGDGTTSRKHGGTGLGLTISRQLATLLGGEIHLHSQLGKGSTFTLYLPLRYPINENLSIQKEKAELPNFEQHKLKRDLPIAKEPIILIIEDDKKFSSLLSQHLSSRGLKYVLCTTGENGFKTAIEIQPSAIILDVGLPDMNGLHLLEHFQRDPKTKHIPVHVISADNVQEECLEKGALGFIKKPLNKAKLNDLLDKASHIIQEPIQNILIVEDNATQRKAIGKLIQSDNIQIFEANNAKKAKTFLEKQRIHCMILDLSLPEISGIKFLKQISTEKKISLPPIIIYTARNITEEEELVLNQYTPSIIIKSADAPQRLVDEVNLFLNTLNKKSLSILDNPEEIHVKIDEKLKGKKVLLVDDDMRNNIALGSYLRKHGLSIITADNGELALRRLDEETTIDLVLMDIMMPVMDGYTTIKCIRKSGQYSKIPIIALTAKAMLEDRDKCIKAGANDYLTKPVDIEKLFNVMHVWLSK